MSYKVTYTHVCIHTEKTNSVFEVKYDHAVGHFICHFVGYENTTCRIILQALRSPSNKYQVENISNSNLVIIKVPAVILQDLKGTELMFHFVALGTTKTLTIAVEDTVKIVTGRRAL